MVGVQALASGLAIVAGNLGGFVDLVKPGENGFLFYPDDAVEMIQGLGELLNDPKMLLKSRTRSLEIAKRFDLPSIVSSYEELFSKLNDTIIFLTIGNLREVRVSLADWACEFILGTGTPLDGSFNHATLQKILDENLQGWANHGKRIYALINVGIVESRDMGLGTN